MKGTYERLAASEFKAKCLRVLEDVREHGREYVITKRGEAVARLVPIGDAGTSARGRWRGMVSVRGDIVHGDWSDEFEAAR